MFLDGNTEMIGYKARLALVRLVKLTTGDRHKKVCNGACLPTYHLGRFLQCLLDLQRIAYSQERTPKMILQCYNRGFTLMLLLKTVIPSTAPKHPLVNVPYHNISVHMAEDLRLVSLRSINAEEDERLFATVK